MSRELDDVATVASDTAAATHAKRILFPSPIGRLGMELHGETITRVVIDPEGDDAARFVPFEQLYDEPDGPLELYDEIFGRLSEYFAGARKQLELDADLKASGLTGFDLKVLQEVARIPYGKTRTYQRIASAAGQPDGYRQVLAVLVVNPLPILVPCHRVVTNKSGVGSYIAGKEKKRWLLDMEKAHRNDAV